MSSSPESAPTRLGRARAKLLTKKAAAVLGLAAVGVGSFFAIAQSSPPSIPAINLSAEPLYAIGTRDKPTLTLALSVEFPTVGAQYVNSPGATSDNSYNPANEYIGYFDAESCYTYVNNSEESLRRFDRTGAATSRTCGGTGFSGNFMNWATSSSIDVLRYGLTGGDRVVDTTSLTVLQRAVLPQGRFWNDANFPSKRLISSRVAGAVPNSLKGTYTGDIYVANCLNRVHFGTAAEGGCDAPGQNSNLGIAATKAVGPIQSASSRPSGFNTECADRGEECSFSGVLEVAYGRNNNWRFAPALNGVTCSESIFTGGSSNENSKCYTRPYTGTWTPPGASNGTAVLSSNPFFYSRVRVCESSGSTLLDPRQDLCFQYPNGNYKPVGNLQKYSDRVRVAAFGYLIDNTQARYGGVLRAPMKYVGPKTYDSNGTLSATTNPKLEWNESTGVFIENPEQASEGKSGVISYLNQFGRTGSTIGTYKTNDPVGELYYESLRYIQGLSPTSNATSGMTTAQKDGFPVYETWTDPHAGGSNTGNYSCLKNNILAIGDVNTHNDKSIPGNLTRLADNEFRRDPNVAANEPDFTFWTRVVDSFETNNAVNYTIGGVTHQATNPFVTQTALRGLQTANTGATLASYYMAGMAYWANTNDIRGSAWTDQPAKQRPGMRATTYILDVNEFARQSVADTRRASQFFLAAKYGGFRDRSGKGNPFLAADGTRDNSNWEKPTEPGEARTYFLSSSARAVLQALDGIFATIAVEGNSIAGGAISTQTLTSNETGYIYQAQFDASDWSGDLISYPITTSNTFNVSVGETVNAQWRASVRLDAKAPSSRKIFVGRVTPTADSAATEFLWSSIESGLATALNKATPSSPADTLGQSRLNFIRGDRSLEGTTFRRRGSVMGDIVNSGVVFTGSPSPRFSDPDYRAFVTANANRVKALYVGANDGMLHAFNSANGEELFGYIPSWLGPKLPALGSSSYNISGHQSYADGSPAVSEAKVGSDWKTVLVSGTGAGGQGVFALDVTNPDPSTANGNSNPFDASKVMWEFTDRDDVDMGNVVGKPQILKFRTSAPNATPAYKWFAVVPSGVNNYIADGNFSLTGRPSLFILDLSKPRTTAWTLGSNYFKISLPLNSSVSSTVSPGLVNFNATLGLADEVTEMYMGDLHGSLWKLNFKPWGTGDWNIGKVSSFYAADGTTPMPLYIARDASNKVQPITVEPALISAPNNSTVVLFGTGRYFESADNVVNSSTQNQSVYAIFDNNSGVADRSSPASVVGGRGRLQAGSVSSAGVVTVPSFFFGRATSDTDATQRSGWYFDFREPGERQISSFGTFGVNAIFGSVVPPDALAGSCGVGSGKQYSVNVATGNGSSQVSTVGILGEPLVLELPGASTLSLVDNTGRRVKTERGQIILQGSTGLVALPTQPTDAFQVGRLSWRQISNYHELKNAP